MQFNPSEIFKNYEIYQKFRAQEEDFFITILPEEYFDDALDLLSEFVVPEETFCRAISIHLKKTPMKIMMETYRELFKQKMTLACFEKSSHKLVGLNVLGLKVLGQNKNSTEEDPDLKILRHSSEITSKLYNVFNSFSVEKYIHGFGLGVQNEYRGRGIAVELLKNRKKLMESLGVKVTFTTFSTLSSQKSAKKAGYVEVSSISYENLQKFLPDFDFSHKNGEECKSFILT